MEKKLKILVLSESYPGLIASSMAYVHTRNQYYLNRGHSVEVLSFQAEQNYQFEGIKVFSENHFKKKGQIEDFDLIVSHAPNLKNHIRFIISQYRKIKNLVFVIHGHEVLKKLNYYPLPFKGLEKNQYNVGQWSNHLYDLLKVKILGFLSRHYLGANFRLIFVSRWMEEQFAKNLKVPTAETEIVSDIIPNSVNSVFENSSFDPVHPKLADFITIRSFDNPKYAVDLIVEAAKQNPEFQFHLYGQGTYFKQYECPKNLKVIEQFFNQKDLPALLNQYRAALMPTRLDSQGVMMCEMATFGMPVVTSDLPICHEMLSGFDNVEFVASSHFQFNAKNFLEKVRSQVPEKNKKFFAENTVRKELELFLKIVQNHQIPQVLQINDIAYVGSSLLREQIKTYPKFELVEMPKPLADYPLPLKIFGVFERWSYARVIKKKIRMEGFNIVHIHFVSSSLWFLNIKLPLIVHAHGSDVRVSRYNFIRRLLNFVILWRADYIFYSTPDLKKYFKHWNEKATFIPNPIDYHLFSTSETVKPTRDILLHSTLSEIKGAGLAVKALNKIKSKRPDLKISIFAFGDMIEKLNISKFEKIQKTPREQLPAIIHDHKVILGQFKVGAVGMSDLEAISCGKPLITFFEYGEVYEEPIPILNAKNEEEIFSGIEAVLDNVESFQAKANQYHKWVEKYHSIEKVVQKIEGFYLRGVNSKKTEILLQK